MASRQEIKTLGEHNKAVTSVAFTNDGRTLASASAGGTIKLWLGATDAEVARQRNR